MNAGKINGGGGSECVSAFNRMGYFTITKLNQKCELTE